jgi:hypothetical protein
MDYPPREIVFMMSNNMSADVGDDTYICNPLRGGCPYTHEATPVLGGVFDSCRTISR